MNPVLQINELIREKNFGSALQALKTFLTGDKNNLWAWKMTGAVHRELGQPDDALAAFARGLEISPGDKELLSVTGLLYYERGDFSSAYGCFERALQGAGLPDYRVAKFAVISLVNLGRESEACERARELIKNWPNDLDAHLLYGQTLQRLGQHPAAIELLEKACGLAPDCSEAYYLVGQSARRVGDSAKALTAHQKAAQLAPHAIDIQLGLAQCLQENGLVLESAEMYEKLVKRYPDNTILLNRFGSILTLVYRANEAVGHLKKSISINPDAPSAYNILANAYKMLGQVADAEQCYLEALQRDGGNDTIHSNRLLNLAYLPDIDNRSLYEEHVKWAEKAAAGLTIRTAFGNAPDPGRRIRIGYVSADLRDHAVHYCMEPVLANHDHGGFEIFCYYNHHIYDPVTRRFMSYADRWIDIRTLNNEAVYDRIVSDEIDILVDLSGHTSGNRLPVFLRRPAPVQVTYECYPHTTGINAIDYKFTDSVLDRESDQQYYAERLYWLDDCFICYTPQQHAPDIMEPPVMKNGYPTFGSFSNLFKINNSVLEAWSRVLRSTRHSRLLLFRRSIDADTVARLRGAFADLGVDPSRVTLLSEIPERWNSLPPGAAHLGLISEVDVLLDTFPYSSHTIALEGLWQGVPTVTLRGNRHASRVCASFLHALGLGDLAATSIEEYVEIAQHLAENRERLRELRKSLRVLMKASPLMQYRDFTRKLEGAYKEIWARWCREQGNTASARAD